MLLARPEAASFLLKKLQIEDFRARVELFDELGDMLLDALVQLVTLGHHIGQWQQLFTVDIAKADRADLEASLGAGILARCAVEDDRVEQAQRRLLQLTVEEANAKLVTRRVHRFFEPSLNFLSTFTCRATFGKCDAEFGQSATHTR